MVFAIRHGVLFYEAMGLFRFLPTFSFGVFIYEATRHTLTPAFSLAPYADSALGCPHYLL
jgi:hypothetical protein